MRIIRSREMNFEAQRLVELFSRCEVKILQREPRQIVVECSFKSLAEFLLRVAFDEHTLSSCFVSRKFFLKRALKVPVCAENKVAFPDFALCLWWHDRHAKNLAVLSVGKVPVSPLKLR